MATPLSKEEYLKRYVSRDDGRKKKKKIRKSDKPKPIPRSRIVDDDIGIKSIVPKEGVEYEVELGEDAPQVAGFVDERPEDVQKRELFSQKDKWRVLGGLSDNEDSNSVVDVDGASNSVTGRWSSKAVKEDSDNDSVARSNNMSPVRRRRLDSNSDESPPRRSTSERIEQEKKRSPLRHNRHDSGSDQSPPRNSIQKSLSDQSPPRKSKKSSNSDQTARRRTRNDSESDQSPSRRKKRNDSGSDQSPPRRRVRNDSGSDQSPPRRRAINNSKNDQSPTRRQARNDSGSAESPPRRKARSDTRSDQSPPRRRTRNDSGSDQSPPRRRQRSKTPERPVKPGEQMKKTLDGKRAGLQSAATLRKENEAARERERKLYEKAGDKNLGRNAETIVRDRKSGRKRDFVAERLQKEEDEAVKKAREEKYKQWSKGLTQANMQNERLETDLRTVSKPLARYREDEDLEKLLREREHQDDPMLDFIRKKKRKAAGQDPSKELPKYNGPPPPPNRYGIQPGYRWDGVDRSNGFEKARVTRHNDRLANLEQAYKWSVEDM